MKNIKTKSGSFVPKTIDRSALLAQRMKSSLVSTKEKTDDVKNDSPTDYAQDKAGEAAQLVSIGVERGLMSTRRRANKTNIVPEPQSAESSAADSPQGAYRGNGSILQRTSRSIEPVQQRPNRNTERVWRSTGRSTAPVPQSASRNAASAMQGVNQKTAQTARRAAARAQATAYRARKATESATNAVKKMGRAAGAVLRKITEAVKSLIAALGAGGAVVVILVIVIILIAMLVASPFGIFLSGEAGENGYSMKQTTAQLTEEYYNEIKSIERTVAHDRVEVKSSDGLAAINWADVLAVYAVKTTSGQGGMDVATMDDTKLDTLRGVMWDMNDISFSTTVTTKQVEVVEIEDGEEKTELKTISETILVIDLTHKTSEEAAAFYAFTPTQNAQLAELQSDKYAHLWTNLIGAFRDANGEIIVTDADWIGTGFFTWPLPINGDFNSGFGYRSDPFDGSIKFHGGIDLGAPQDTLILAAAGGTVTIANATDPWGYGYGYYVRIDHGNGYATLYGHCNAVAVSPGQTVQQGQVIAYVGTTGNSTGNHLHFEVYEGGTRVDPLGFFRQ